MTAFALVSLSTLACSRAHHLPPAMAAGHVADHGQPGPASATLLLPAYDDVAPERDVSLRAPGDFVVYRFSGKLKKPMTLTERVVAQEGDSTAIDFTLEDGARVQTLRVRMAGSPAEPKVQSAAWLDGAIEGAVPASTFDALLARTVVAADRNDGLIGTERATVTVDGKAIPCTRKTFRVLVGRKSATMSTCENASFAWGDVAGEMRAADGTLLYKAEVVHAGSAPAAGDLVVKR